MLISQINNYKYNHISFSSTNRLITTKDGRVYQTFTQFFRTDLNWDGLVEFLEKVKKIYPQKTIWCYSGYTFEELTGESRARCEVTDEILLLVDILVDGEFIEELKDISLRFRGSSNQRIIDMNKTRKSGEIVLWDGEK